ncbi:hypothetical protein PILCRDRAFT_824800 [Piloderma croceum F 1598]|uniref:Uncharacterized protein n=1 Tax=Piloderma croceum (strain F 1598) TaxID=765440 RepID=A0A0C3FDW2_PILCF|nr:hypothetical protein PILCRDRAFT_824800 [Piloderma croceum F 1598]
MEGIKTRGLESTRRGSHTDTTGSREFHFEGLDTFTTKEVEQMSATIIISFVVLCVAAVHSIRATTQPPTSLHHKGG